MTDTYQPTAPADEPEPADYPAEEAAEPPAPAKVSQEQANYRRGTPTKHCGVCVYYEGEDTKSCSQVDGPISGFGISDVFKMQSNPFGSTIGPREAAIMDGMMNTPPDRSAVVRTQRSPTIRIGNRTY